MLQARLPAYMQALHKRRAAAAARRSNQAWLARACLLRAHAHASTALAAPSHEPVLAALQLYAQAAQLACRSGNGTVLLNVLSQAWDAMRRLFADARALVPHEPAHWEQRSSESDQGDVNGALWSCKAAPPSLGRAITSLVSAALAYVAALRDGHVQLWTGARPLTPPSEPRKKRVAEPADALSDLGSEAPPDVWFAAAPQLDFAWLNTVLLGTFRALCALRRPATALALGRDWHELSCGQFDRSLLPALAAAAAQADVDLGPLQRCLKAVERDVNASTVALERARAAAAATLGVVPPMAQMPRAAVAATSSADAAPDASQATSVDNVKVRHLCLDFLALLLRFEQ